MRNETKIEKIFALIKKLPYFDFDILTSVEPNKTYLKILLSRHEKKNKVIRLKRGMYVAKDYLDEMEKKNLLSFYSEFLANILYQPSYLSLDYVLYQHNLLTEIPKNFTSVTLNKTGSFSNALGNFFYHKIKNDLFCGFLILKEGDFTIFKATKAKALFDFLYLRKNEIIDKKSIEELRLNFENISKKDFKEFEKYVKMESSKKMKEIYGIVKTNF
jgi:predicted transcriptional regulator of viral defense system